MAGFFGNNWQAPAYKKANNIMISNISSSLSVVIMSKSLLSVKICHGLVTVMRGVLYCPKKNPDTSFEEHKNDASQAGLCVDGVL